VSGGCIGEEADPVSRLYGFPAALNDPRRQKVRIPSKAISRRRIVVPADRSIATTISVVYLELFMISCATSSKSDSIIDGGK